MGQARETFDRATDALLKGDLDGVGTFCAEDAVAITPDLGEIKGRDGIIGYFRTFWDAFSDISFEFRQKHESGNNAIDEGWFVGTHTGPLPSPDGETIPPTGKSVRVHECDMVTVEDGLITSHRFYFDQMDFLSQLGLTQ